MPTTVVGIYMGQPEQPTPHLTNTAMSSTQQIKNNTNWYMPDGRSLSVYLLLWFSRAAASALLLYPLLISGSTKSAGGACGPCSCTARNTRAREYIVAAYYLYKIGTVWPMTHILRRVRTRVGQQQQQTENNKDKVSPTGDKKCKARTGPGGSNCACSL